MKENSTEDYIKFCFIKDSLIFNKKFSLINKKCFVCDSDKHSLTRCEKIHLNYHKKTILDHHINENPF